MQDHTLKTFQSQLPVHEKQSSFQTQNSIITGASRKKYYIKKKRINNPLSDSTTASLLKSNIFNLTSSPPQYCQLPQQPQSHYSTLFNPQSSSEPQPPHLLLPIITQSKYNYKLSSHAAHILPSPVSSMQALHNKSPVYIKNASNAQHRNLNKLSEYQKLWSQSANKRPDISLLTRSKQKSLSYIQKHNIDLLYRKATIEFQNILRDRNKKQENRIGELKGMPREGLPGLRGKGGARAKGGSVVGLWEGPWMVQEVYKIDK